MTTPRLLVLLVDHRSMSTLTDHTALSTILFACGLTEDDIVEVHALGQNGYTICPATPGFSSTAMTGLQLRDPGPRTPGDTDPVFVAIARSQAILRADESIDSTTIVNLSDDRDGRISSILSTFGPIIDAHPRRSISTESGQRARANTLRTGTIHTTLVGSAPGPKTSPSTTQAINPHRSRSALAMCISVTVLSLLAGIISYYATEGASTPSSQRGLTPTSSPIAPITPLGSFFDARAGQCVNQLLYATKLNAPELQAVPCDDAAVRMNLLSVTPDGDGRPCSTDTLVAYSHNDWQYCFQLPVKPGYCYPTWMGERGSDIETWTAFTLPHACDESIAVTDDELPRPSDGMGVTNIHRIDVLVLAINSSDHETPCAEWTFKITGPVEQTMCGRAA